MTDRQAQAIATKQKILDAAEALITERGFDNVSVDDIVQMCAVAKGTFYHYFKSKDELAIYVTRSPYEYLRKEYESTAYLPSLERLKLLLESWFKLVDKFNLHFSRQAVKIYADPNTRGEYGGNVSHMDLGMELVRECLADSVSSGQLAADTPVDVLTREIMFSMQGSTLFHCKYAEAFDVMAWSSDFLELVFGSLLKPYIKE